MADITLHPAATRGHADHGWLNTYHTFSFAGYYDPKRLHFGVLRVLNDDTVAGGMGFGMHPHDNMEIITIPLSGDLEHKDSMGNSGVIKQGDVQVMSAGTGIYHSEFNANKDKDVSLLQIWVFPDKQGVTPRYDQKTFGVDDRRNRFQQVVSPMDSNEEGMHIHQDAWFNLARLEKDTGLSYTVKKSGNGVYAFIISGDVTINGQELHARDGMGISDADTLSIKAGSEAELLLMDVPMQIS